MTLVERKKQQPNAMTKNSNIWTIKNLILDKNLKPRAPQTREETRLYNDDK